MKDIFKRLTAKVAKPTTKPRAPSENTLSSKLNNILAVFLLAVIALCGAAYYFFEAEITATTDNIMQYFGDAPPVKTSTNVIHRAPTLRTSNALTSASMVLSSSGVSDASSGAISTPSTISGVVAASAIAASGIIANASAVIATAASSVASVDPVFDSMPDMPDMPNTPEMPAPNKEPSVSTPSSHHNYGSRPHNRDVRSCLKLGSDEAIAHCVYPR